LLSYASADALFQRRDENIAEKEKMRKNCSSMLTVILLALISTSGVIAQSAGFKGLILSVEVTSLTSHAPILIIGDASFTAANGVVSGSGTAGEPYIIEGWDINASSAGPAGIVVCNTTRHFVIRDVFVHDGGSSIPGILFWNVTNGQVLETKVTKSNPAVALALSSGNKISNNTITSMISGGSGVMLVLSSSNIVSGNTLTDIYAGIWLLGWFTGIEGWGASSNTISGNTLTNNQIGVVLSNATSNTVSNNTVTYSSAGIWLVSANSSQVSRNTITWLGFGSPWGIVMRNSTSNKIYHNNFINGSALLLSLPNEWDDGYPSGGNFWSDYTGTDLNGDGIGDTPYTIDANNQDRYPLIFPVVWDYSSPVPIVWQEKIYRVALSSNSSISAFKFNQQQKQISFNVTGSTGTVGYCNITIPKNLLSGSPWVILIDDVAAGFTQTENDTHTTLSFTYTHSTKTVQITGTTVVPEFLSTIIILPVFMLLSLLGVVSAKKKRFGASTR